MNQLSPIIGFCLVFDPRRSSGCVSKTYIKIIRMKFAQLIFTYSAKISTSLDVEGKKSCSEMVVAKWSEVKVAQSCPTLCDPMKYTVHGMLQAGILGMGSLSLLQGIFPTQGSNPGLPHYSWIFYQLSHKGSPRIMEWVEDPFSSGSSWPRNQTRVSCIVGRFFTNWAIREALILNK